MLPQADAARSSPPDLTRLSALWCLAGIGLLFLLLRVPVMYLQPGGQDEDCYAVPGWTVTQNGIPRMPHTPARNPESVFFRADQALYAEPPAYFYIQALFYLALPDVYGTGRMASAFSALLALGLVFAIARQTGSRRRMAVLAAGLFSLSRWFYFPAISARPDMLCSVFGLLSVLLTFRWTRTQHRKWLIAAGACIGAGGLTHPFAIVYAVQIAVWVALKARGWSRLLLPSLVAGIAVAVTGLWLPLIALYPDAFQVQFQNQFLRGQSPGLLTRMVFPWASLDYQWLQPQGMVAHIGLWQIVLTFVPVVTETVFAIRRKDSASLSLCALIWSSLYLLTVFVGTHHPVIGYWSYSAALMFLCVGRTSGTVVDWLAEFPMLTRRQPTRARHTAGWLVAGVLMLSMLPGAGLRTLLAHFRHRGEINYNAPEFARQLIRSLPSDALVAADTQFVFDFLVSGRRVLLAHRGGNYLRLEDFPYDYVIVSRAGIDARVIDGLPVVLESTHGDKHDLFACYCEVYRRSPPRPVVSPPIVTRRSTDGTGGLIWDQCE